MRLPNAVSTSIFKIFEQIRRDFEEQANGEGPLFPVGRIETELRGMDANLELLKAWDNGGYQPHFRRTYYLISVAEDAERLSTELTRRRKFERLRLLGDLSLDIPGYLPISKGTQLALAIRSISIIAEEAAAQVLGFSTPQPAAASDVVEEEELEKLGLFAGDPEAIELDITGKKLRTILPNPYRQFIVQLRNLRRAAAILDDPSNEAVQKRFERLEQLIGELFLAGYPPSEQQLIAISNEAERLREDKELRSILRAMGNFEALNYKISDRASSATAFLQSISKLAHDSAHVTSAANSHAEPVAILSSTAAGRISAIVPEQQIAPVRFGWVGDKLSVLHVHAAPEDGDVGIVASVRKSIEKTGKRLLEELENTQCDRRFLRQINELHTELLESADIVYVGIQSQECHMAAKAFSEEFSTFTQSLVTAYFSSILNYVAQFPEWQRFLENAAAAKLLEEAQLSELRAVIAAAHSAITNSDFVTDEVPLRLGWLSTLISADKPVTTKTVMAVAVSIQNMASAVVRWVTSLLIETADKTKKLLVNAGALTLVAAIGAALWKFIPVSNIIAQNSWLETALEWLRKVIPLIKG